MHAGVRRVPDNGTEIPESWDNPGKHEITKRNHRSAIGGDPNLIRSGQVLVVP
jgi:hypothetical protein